MTDKTIHLNDNDILFLMSTLGDLPSRTGAWQLIVKIQAQLEQQNQPTEPSVQLP